MVFLNSEYCGVSSGSSKARSGGFATSPEVQFPGTVPSLGAGVTAPPSLPLPSTLPRLHRHPPLCTARHSKLEHASLGSTSKPPTHPRGSPAGPVAAQRALPQELLLQRQGKLPEGFSHQDICFPVVPSPFQAPQAPCAACLHSQAQRRLKNNRQETCGVPKHFSALPKG